MELVVDLGHELACWVRGDVTGPCQVLFKLVNNTAKLSDPGQVRVSV